MIILAKTTLVENFSSEWINGDKKKFDTLENFRDGRTINNWALQFEWDEVQGTANAEIKVYSTLEKVKTLEYTKVIDTASNVGDALIVDFSGSMSAGFHVELELNDATSIDLSIDAVLN